MTNLCLPEMVHRHTYVEIDLARLKANFEAFCNRYPANTFICPMVKANAYGHGAVECAQALRAAGARNLGVGMIEEGLQLREAGDRGSILIFGLFGEESATAVLDFSLTPVISNWTQLKSLSKVLKAHSEKKVAIHIKFNTGMNRLGFHVSEATKLRSWLENHPMFKLQGICTHLQRGADAGDQLGESETQLSALHTALSSFADLKFEVHALNSSAALNLWARLEADKPIGSYARGPIGLRPGIGLYGVAPGQDEDIQLDLQPVMSFKSQIVMLHRLKAGEKVSYNGTWQAQRPTLLGVVAAGYADGVMRLLSNKGDVLCRGTRVPIAGTVCMDYFMIDLTDVAGEVLPGEEVVLFGAQENQIIRVEELAEKVGTIAYEILTRISERVPRNYLKNSNI